MPEPSPFGPAARMIRAPFIDYGRKKDVEDLRRQAEPRSANVVDGRRMRHPVRTDRKGFEER